jgi:hypothetical protein
VGNVAVGVDHRRKLLTSGRVDILEVAHKRGREYQAGKGVRLSSVFFVKFSPSSEQGEDVSTVFVCNGHLRKYNRACQGYRGVEVIG